MMKENPDISAIAFVLRKIAADLEDDAVQSERAAEAYLSSDTSGQSLFRIGYLWYACTASADLIRLCADWLEEEDAQ